MNQDPVLRWPHDYRTATEEQILAGARLLVGRRLGEIPGARFRASSGARGRGEVGRAIETFFGIPANAISSADFPGAGVELKVVPLVRTGDGLRAKERTVIGQIDYATLPSETWASAHVRSKLERILFIFFEHLPGESKERFPILAAHLWTPTGRLLDLIRADWSNVRSKVAAGRAHELSESDGRVMGPCTKAAHGRVRRAGGADPTAPSARPRAWALKPALTTYLNATLSGSTGQMASLAEKLGLTDLDKLEAVVRLRLRRFVGRTVDDIAAELGIEPSLAKSFAANVIRTAVGVSAGARIREFEETGLTIRTTRVGPNGRPYEAMSFPAFRHMELIEEEWEDSRLLALIENMLILPFYGATRETPAARCVLLEPVFWRPSAAQLETAEREWRMFRDLIRAGRANELPGSAATRVIHVRPHARNSRDTDPAPGVGPVVKKSFWLNQDFVAELVRPSLDRFWGMLHRER